MPISAETLRSIQDAAQNAGLTRSGDKWVGLGGGRSNNHIWKIFGQNQVLVCKLYAPDAPSPLFPNDACAEWRALDALSRSGLAPELAGQLNTTTGTCIFYHFVDGVPAGHTHEQAGRTLRALHERQAPDWLRTVEATQAGIMKHGDRMLARLPSAQQKSLECVRPDIVEPPKRQITPVFLHGDPVPNNFVTGGAVTLIDWQCPARGHPVHDLTVYLSPAMQSLYGNGPLTDAERAAFLAGYGNPDAEDWLATLGPACHWRIAVHCAWRANRGDADYAQALALEIAAL